LLLVDILDKNKQELVASKIAIKTICIYIKMQSYQISVIFNLIDLKYTSDYNHLILFIYN
jgi:hypothetical protein